MYMAECKQKANGPQPVGTLSALEDGSQTSTIFRVFSS